MRGSWVVDMVLYGYLFLTLVRSKCSFPSFMQARHEGYTWEQRHSSQTVLLSVKRSEMYIKVVCLKGSAYCKSYEYVRRCVKDSDGVLMVHQDTKKRVSTRHSVLKRYACLQIIRRSDAVFQIMTSLPTNAQIEPINCSVEALKLDYRPFVSYDKFFDVQMPCLFSGGYSFKMMDSGNRSICEKFMLPLRIESDCYENDGMNFRFREKKCMGIFETGEFQDMLQLRCLATWSDNTYSYSVVGRNDATSYWCLRLTQGDVGMKEIHVFNNGDCQNTRKLQTKEYMVLRDFTKHIVTTTCADQFQYCEDVIILCSTPNRKVFCNESCGYCQPMDDTSSCSFPRLLHGKWKQTTTSSDITVHITDKNINIDPYGDLKCIDSTNSFISRRKLLKLFHNGCYPRYMCLEFDRPSPSVMRYRLGRILHWPLPEPDLYRYICDNTNFDVNVRSRTDRPRDTPVMGMIPRRHIIDTSSVSYVPCTLPWFIPQTVYFVSDTIEQGCLVHEMVSSPHKITLKYLKNSYVSMQKEFVCLASMKSVGENDRIMTQSMENSMYLCWIFYNKSKIGVYTLDNCEGIELYRNYYSLSNPVFSLTLFEKSNSCNSVVTDMQSRLKLLNLFHEPAKTDESVAPKLTSSVFYVCFMLLMKLSHFIYAYYISGT